MAETRDLQPYDPEEANRRLRALLRETIQKAQRGGRWLIASQVLVAMATVALVIVSILSLLKTSDQIAAVRASIGESRRQFNISQRPWVGVTDFQITNVEVGKKPRAVVRVTNRGATPAKTRTRTNISILPKMPKKLPYWGPPQVSDVVLLPNTGIDTPADFPRELSKQDIVAIDGGEQVIYAYGYSEYEDSRGEPYRTNFCIFWDPQNMKYFLCPIHNDFE